MLRCPRQRCLAANVRHCRRTQVQSRRRVHVGVAALEADGHHRQRAQVDERDDRMPVEWRQRHCPHARAVAARDLSHT
eukprot:364340-Chlamydomonas_euryale.AAC.4